MAGALSSLGIGSNVLTYDVIEKLRKADEDGILKPIDSKVGKNTEKQSALADLKTSLAVLKSSASKISDTSSYLQRKTSVAGEGVSATAAAGLLAQNINIEVKKLAKSDIYEVGSKFSSRSDTFSNYNSRLHFQQGDKSYYIDIAAGETLEDVAQKITDKTDGAITGTILKTGGEKPYQLMINAKDTGEENKIYFGNSVTSGFIIGGALEPDTTGDLTITLKDKNGNDVTLDIAMPSTNMYSTSSDNAQALRDAIKSAITAYGSDLSDLVFDKDDVGSSVSRNKPITIDVVGNNNKILINDARGENITVGGTYASTLGFASETKSISQVVMGTTVASAKLDGKMNINGVEVSITTSVANTSSQNAQAVVDAINSAGIPNVTAELNERGDGFNLLDSNRNQIEITTAGADDTEKSKSSAFIQSLGIKIGTYNSGAFLLEDKMKLDNIQVGRDAEILYNDMKITRSGNYIDDIISGLSITLEKEHSVGDKSVVSISQDIEAVIEDVKEFVKSYNELIDKLADYTKYDADTGVSGIFQGESNITSIKSYLNNILLTTDGNNKSLVAYGIYLNENGKLDIDTDKLETNIKANPASAESLFRGYTATVSGQEKEFDGIFKKFYNYLDKMLKSTTGTLSTFGDSLESEADKLTDSRKKAVSQLDSRYEIMAARFAAYDSIIAGMNSSFSSLQMMITQSING